MKLIKNKKIFDIRNPNCTISTPIGEIAKMFDKTPILIKDEVGVFGFVDTVTGFDDNCIYGDIVFFDKYNLRIEDIGEMYNYEAMIRDIIDEFGNEYSVTIDRVLSVTYCL
jgi:hypothetical protein